MEGEILSLDLLSGITPGDLYWKRPLRTDGSEAYYDTLGITTVSSHLVYLPPGRF